MKKTSIFLFLFVSVFCYSQNSKPEIIKKDIPNLKADDVYDYHNTNQQTTPFYNNKYNSKTKVYYNNKFYSSDTLRKIKNLEQYEINLIKIPKNITEDIDGIIYIRKKN